MFDKIANYGVVRNHPELTSKNNPQGRISTVVVNGKDQAFNNEPVLNYLERYSVRSGIFGKIAGAIYSIVELAKEAFGYTSDRQLAIQTAAKQLTTGLKDARENLAEMQLNQMLARKNELQSKTGKILQHSLAR